jgi:hypothetical protein
MCDGHPHPDLPAGGHEEDPIAITDREEIR